MSSTTNDPTVAVACDLTPISSPEELRELHKASVIRHANILADSETSAKDKIIAYFEDLLSFLAAHQFSGCPFGNALVASHRTNPEVFQEVSDHKEFTREFLVSLASELTTPCRSVHVGEHLFLLYTGATTESQNLHTIWPAERAVEVVTQLVHDELEMKELRKAALNKSES